MDDQNQELEQLRNENKELKEILSEHGLLPQKYLPVLKKEDKIRIYLDYFAGRTDTFAYRYYSRKRDQYGWNPVCRNNMADVCPHASGSGQTCLKCPHRSFRGLKKEDLENYFTGKAFPLGIGLYPLMDHSLCQILAIDFDEDDWFHAMRGVYETALSYGFYPVMERSNSGAGGHLWFFFAVPVRALLARRMGEGLLRESMKHNRNLSFSSFDRLFPNQDYLPENGVGNLIALPLNGSHLSDGKTFFLSEEGTQIPHPFDYLRTRKKITAEELVAFLNTQNSESYFFDQDQLAMRLETGMKFSSEIKGTRGAMLRFEKRFLNAATLLQLRSLSSMWNPKFFEVQKNHRSVYEIARVRSFCDEDEKCISLPRGIEENLVSVFPESRITISDQTTAGEPIEVSFLGKLRKNQEQAAPMLLKHDLGILNATTGFGKTVLGIWIIAQLKVSTLILVPRISILNQWINQIHTFLDYPDKEKKQNPYVRKLKGGSKNPGFHIDVASMDTVSGFDHLEEFMSHYGLLIIDEVHRAGSETCLKILRNTPCRYIYGFTATPKREDGLEKAIFMFCGPIRFQESIAEARRSYTFRQVLIPRYTAAEILGSKITPSSLLKELSEDQARNFLIFQDIHKEYNENQKILVFSERIEHLNVLFKMLEDADIYTELVTGAMNKTERNAAIERLKNHDSEQGFVLLSTSSLLGEGFDLPILSCLFLTLPISGESRIIQYTGRIHRNYEGKDLVKVYDYVDSRIPMAMTMYGKRLKQYQKEGYGVHEQEAQEEISVDRYYYAGSSWHEPWNQDLTHARKEVLFFLTDPDLYTIQNEYQNLNELVHRGINLYFVLNTEIQNSSVSEYLSNLGEVLKAPHQQNFVLVDRSIVWNSSHDFLSPDQSTRYCTRENNPEHAEELRHIPELKQKEPMILF